MRLFNLCASTLFFIGALIARDPHLRLMLAVVMLALATMGCSVSLSCMDTKGKPVQCREPREVRER